jgi:ribosomal protein S8
MPITLDKFINILNVSIKNQLKSVELKGILSSEVKESLNLLFKEGFIRGFSTEGRSTLIDFRFEDTGKNIISNLTFLKKSSFQNNIPIANL